MNETITMDLNGESLREKPGAQLALIRSHRGYRTDYVAEKLNLRVQLIELLEADDYPNMPEPVFIKGYLRAYAKLLDVDPEGYIALFNQYYVQEAKTEPLLWQSSRQSNKAEHTLRWVTAAFALVVFIAVMIWWHNTNEHEVVFPQPGNQTKVQVIPETRASTHTKDFSKMPSLLPEADEMTVALDTPSE